VKQSTKEVKAKGEKFSELAKRNELHHHLGMTGYAAKMEKWWQEEREAAEAGHPNPLQGIDERSRNYLYAPRPKRLKEGRTKYNSPREGCTNRGAGKPRAPRPRLWGFLEAELEGCGVLAIRRQLLPHEAEVQGRACPERP
jgi:hypothetical protein